MNWVASSKTMTIYTNGVLVPSPTSTSGFGIGNSVDAAYIGSRSDNLGYFNGFIDDVRIYNRALSSDEILKLYNGGYGSQK